LSTGGEHIRVRTSEPPPIEEVVPMLDEEAKVTVLDRLVDAFDRQDVGCDIWTFGGDLVAPKSSFWKIVER
jgi:hypothetical protein